MFNDLNLGNDVTLISFFRRPHLISFYIIQNKLYDPRNIVSWSGSMSIVSSHVKSMFKLTGHSDRENQLMRTR